MISWQSVRILFLLSSERGASGAMQLLKQRQFLTVKCTTRNRDEEAEVYY